MLQVLSSTLKKLFKTTVMVGSMLAAATMMVGDIRPALASSHREAPLIAGDPKADATDLYAFTSPDNTDTVTLIANYYPFQEPAGGPNFYTFDPNVLYEIHIDNNADAKPDVTYQFQFRTVVRNKGTFLYNTGPVTSVSDPDLNVYQRYTVSKVVKGKKTVLGSNIWVPAVNIGPKSTPDYAALQASAIRNVKDGTKVFAGQSDDPFFVDLGSTFDLLTIRKLPGNDGGGVDSLRGYNVLSLALQVPKSSIKSSQSKVVGVWTTASRRSTRVLNAAKGTAAEQGKWVQVSRLGAPLVNEVVIPIGKKDIWNSSKPANDVQFANYVTNPELGGLLKALYGINVPPQGNFGTADQRDDLTAIFLTGIPGLTKPRGIKPSEQLRLNLTTAVTASPNAMGVLGGDNQGYPNGRRLADDVTDISLRAVAGAAYPLFHPTFTPDSTGVKLGDGVDANDKGFRSSFPYMALPHSGYESVPHQ